MNRRAFVRGSLLACAGASVTLPTYGSKGRNFFFRMENADGASVLRSFAFGDDVNAIDRLMLPPTASLIEHPSLPVLFAMLSAESWQHRSRSAVCSVRYDAATGAFLSQRIKPLSLGAVRIVEAEVAQHAEKLHIATASGIRNVFQLNEQGEVVGLVSVRKTLLL
jgi:hypothetical protein